MSVVFGLQPASARWGQSAHPDPCSVNGHDPCELYSKICELSKAIECARQTLVRLVNEHNDLVYEMNTCHDPVQKLPAEAIGHIFSFCLPTDSHNKSDDIQQDTSPLETPLALGRICRRWRQIAWSAPRLWSTIHVYPGGKNRQMQASFVSEWISRSGQLPLTIRMRAPRRPARDYGHEIDPLLNIIRGIASRWNILELQVTRLTATRLFADGYDLPLQPLQSLVIRIVDTQYSERLEIDYPFSLPRAHYLQLDGFKIDNAQTDWPDTTDLRISRIHGAEVIHFLGLVPQVQSLELAECFSRTVEASLDTTPIILPHLKALAMTKNFCSWVFDYVVAPSLEILTMRDNNWAPTPDSIKAFLSGGHHLRKLTYSLTTGFFAPEERDRALHFLQTFQQISTLTIIHDSKMKYFRDTLVTNSFMRTLVSRSYTPQDGDVPLPFLTSLDHFEYRGPLYFDWESLLRLFDPGTEGPPSCRNLKTLKVRIVEERMDALEKILIGPEIAGKLRELGQGRIRISAFLCNEMIDDLIERSYMVGVDLNRE